MSERRSEWINSFEIPQGEVSVWEDAVTVKMGKLTIWIKEFETHYKISFESDYRVPEKDRKQILIEADWPFE